MKNTLIILLLFPLMLLAQVNETWRASTFTLPGLGVLTKDELYRLQGVTSNVQSQINALVNDTAYDATSWNGVTTSAPSKNAVRDQIETLDAAVVHKTGNESIAGTKTFTGKIKASSTTNGNKPCPDMTDAQMLAVGSPENGDCVFNTTKKSWYIYDSVGVKWKLSSGAGGVGSTDTMWVQNIDAASSSDFTTFTGWAINTSTPLHGDQDLKVTHAAAATTYTVKETSIPVSQFFRGKNITMQIAGKTTATLGNVKLTVRDETNGVDLSLSQNGNTAANTNPSIPLVASGTYPQGDSVYYTFDVPATCALLSWKVDALPETGPPVTSIDDVSFYVTKLSLPTSAVVQDPDIIFFGAGSPASAITANVTNIPYTTVTDSHGAWNSSTSVYTVPKTGLYHISTDVYFAGGAGRSVNLYVNGVLYLDRMGEQLTSQTHHGEFSGYFTEGTTLVLRVNGAGTLGGSSTTLHWLSIVNQGSLKQASVNKNSKITIPTSELRFEGASARGSTDTGIVVFTTQAKIKGDAFSVVSNSVNGTVITMNKSGRLSMVANLIQATTAAGFYLTKNQSILTSGATPTSSEMLGSDITDTTGAGANPQWTGDVIAGDVFRVFATQNPTSDVRNNWHLSFQEQEIQVGVSNTLPQFSESDSYVDVRTGNGMGSTSTAVRRFSSVATNSGVDILYADSATAGASMTAQADGTYSFTYSDSVTAATACGLSKNDLTFSTSTLLAVDQVATSEVMSCSWEGYLARGDVIRPVISGTVNSSSAYARFTGSKTGKPNVTGVNVTPFVNVPQIVTQYIYKNIGSLASSSGVVTGALTTDTATGLLAYDSTNGRYTALKKCSIVANANWANAGAATARIVISKTTSAGSSSTLSAMNSVGTAGYYGNSVGLTELAPGDYISFSNNDNAVNNAQIYINASGLSDTALTATETFSTDTATLTYGSNTYNSTTLANAPVGTFITYTMAVSSATLTQTIASPPSQSTSDMNSNGLRIYSRAFNGSSTSGNPSIFQIQIGKGLKNYKVTGYTTTGKASASEMVIDFVSAGAIEYGMHHFYNPLTGILTISGGTAFSSSTSRYLGYTAMAGATTAITGSAYFTIDASKNPALTGVNSNVVSARATTTSGQSIANSGDVLVQWDTASQINNGGGIITGTSTYAFYAPEAGIYKVGAKVKWQSALYAAGNLATIKIYKNGSLYSTIAESAVDAAVTRTHALEGDDIIRLSKGDYIDIRISNNRSAGATSLSTTAGDNFVDVFKLGGIQ